MCKFAIVQAKSFTFATLCSTITGRAEGKLNRAHLKFSLPHPVCGRWGHRPRRSALAGVLTSQQKFEMHP
jgi:hypothetical protein